MATELMSDRPAGIILTAEPACVGVMCERPGPRGPLPADTFTMIWFCMGIAAVIAMVAGAILWQERRGRKPAPTEPVRDPQEWCHYPQPGDKDRA